MNDMIHLTSSITAAEAYSLHDEIADVKLHFAGDTAEGAAFALYQNEPNPWNEQTNIGFDLPEDAKVVLTIYDVTGKEVLKVNGEYTSGYNVIDLSRKDIPNTGVLYYRLDCGEYSATKKMILIE
jgi:Secretion system C-terminal sorting domain